MLCDELIFVELLGLLHLKEKFFVERVLVAIFLGIIELEKWTKKE